MGAEMRHIKFFLLTGKNSAILSRFYRGAFVPLPGIVLYKADGTRISPRGVRPAVGQK
jgi:hypothetical protein